MHQDSAYLAELHTPVFSYSLPVDCQVARRKWEVDRGCKLVHFTPLEKGHRSPFTERRYSLESLIGHPATGSLHLGNYLGMMRPMISYMDRSELFVFIVNFHALTSVTDPKKLSRGTLEAAADFLALGLDRTGASSGSSRTFRKWWN